jgi:hypothetical protein
MPTAASSSIAIIDDRLVFRCVAIPGCFLSRNIRAPDAEARQGHTKKIATYRLVIDVVPGTIVLLSRWANNASNREMQMAIPIIVTCFRVSSETPVEANMDGPYIEWISVAIDSLTADSFPPISPAGLCGLRLQV